MSDLRMNDDPPQNRQHNSDPPGKEGFGGYLTRSLKSTGSTAWIWAKGFTLGFVVMILGMVVGAMVFESGLLAILSIPAAGILVRMYARHKFEQRAISRHHG